MADDNTVNRVFTATELARVVNMARQTITRLCREGQIPGAYQAGRIWIIPKSAADKFIENVKKIGTNSLRNFRNLPEGVH